MGAAGYKSAPGECRHPSSQAAAPAPAARGTAEAASERLVQVYLGIHLPVGVIGKIQLLWCQRYLIRNLKTCICGC